MLLTYGFNVIVPVSLILRSTHIKVRTNRFNVTFMFTFTFVECKWPSILVDFCHIFVTDLVTIMKSKMIQNHGSFVTVAMFWPFAGKGGHIATVSGFR